MRLSRRWILTGVAIAVPLLIIFITSFAGTWKKMEDMTNARADHRMVEINGMIYVLGNSSISQTHVMAYDLASGKWTRGANMITPRHTMAVAVVNGLIYCSGGGGGGDGAGGISNANEVYDPGSDTWAKLADMPSAAQHVQASVVDDVIYVTSGHIPGTQLRLCLAYDPSTDTWTKKADMPLVQGWSESNVVGKKIYVTGGWHGTALQIYDTVTDTWTKSRARMLGNWGVSTTVHEGKIYIFGGTYQSTTGNGFKIYDPETDTLLKEDGEYSEFTKDKAGIPYNTTEANAVTASDNKIYLMGGSGGSDSNHQLYVYDPLAAPPMNRFSAADSQKRDVAPNIDSKEKLIATWGKLKGDVEK